MRTMLFVIAVLASTGVAQAFENFIPAGTGYSTEIETLPEFNSEQSDINQQADIYETEIYRKQRKYAEDDARLRRFYSQNNSTGGTGINGAVDY